MNLKSKSPKADHLRAQREALAVSAPPPAHRRVDLAVIVESAKARDAAARQRKAGREAKRKVK